MQLIWQAKMRYSVLRHIDGIRSYNKNNIVNISLLACLVEAMFYERS